MRTLTLILATVFITLKCVDKLTWSWFWVLSPLIFYGVAAIVLFCIFNAREAHERAERIKANRERQEEIDKLNNQIKDLSNQLKSTGEVDIPMDLFKLKTVFIVLIFGLSLSSCRPSNGIMKCPKNPIYTYKK
jgi:hypothetical protein